METEIKMLIAECVCLLLRRSKADSVHRARPRAFDRFPGLCNRWRSSWEPPKRLFSCR